MAARKRRITIQAVKSTSSRTGSGSMAGTFSVNLSMRPPACWEREKPSNIDEMIDLENGFVIFAILKIAISAFSVSVSIRCVRFVIVVSPSNTMAFNPRDFGGK